MSEEKATSSVVLKALAKLGWEGRIKGDSLRRNSLLYPLNAIFNQLQRQQNILDLETQRASLAQKLFDYLERIADEDYKPGAGKREKIEIFINLFFDDLLGKVYYHNQQKMLADEKDIKAAYLFYIRAEIPQKEKDK